VSADERLALAFVSDHPDDAARILERQDAIDVVAVLARLTPTTAAAVFRALSPSAAAACAALLSDERLAGILEELPADVMTAVVRRTEPARREPLMARLSADRRSHLADALRFPTDCATT
jgi:Mg/Co/Ni transporter MgtE